MLSRIKTNIHELPLLGDTFEQVVNLDVSDGMSAHHLTKIVENDPMLCANLLRIANSPLYGFSHEISSIFKAITLFGASTSKQLIIKLFVKELLPSDMSPYGIDSAKFVDLSNMQGFFIKSWYKNLNVQDKDIYFLSGLLQESGKLLIAKVLKEEGLQDEFLQKIQSGVDVVEVEREIVQSCTSEVSALLFEYWDFSQTIVDGIKYSDTVAFHTDGEIFKLSQSLRISKNLINIRGVADEHSMNKAIRDARAAQLDEDGLKMAMENILKEKQ